jgi:hypothetical protein
VGTSEHCLCRGTVGTRSKKERKLTTRPTGHSTT